MEIACFVPTRWHLNGNGLEPQQPSSFNATECAGGLQRLRLASGRAPTQTRIAAAAPLALRARRGSPSFPAQWRA